jgi:hypothetical protein
MSANGVRKAGYIFTLAKHAGPDTADVLTDTCNAAVAPRATAFFASAEPITRHVTGIMSLATDTPGVIYTDNNSAIPNPIPDGTDTLR